MKKSPSKVAHNWPIPFFFSTANCPKSSPNLNSCSITISNRRLCFQPLTSYPFPYLHPCIQNLSNCCNHSKARSISQNFGGIFDLVQLHCVRGVLLQTERPFAPEFTVYFADYLYLAIGRAPWYILILFRPSLTMI